MTHLIPDAVPGPIAIANYDFRSSGTVLKSIEIAGALAEAGIPAELWVVRRQGPLEERVPEGVTIVEARSRLRASGREADLALNVPALARMLRKRPPAVLLSGGNHLHLPVTIATRLSGRRRDIRLGLRASNSSRRPRADGSGLTDPGAFDRLKYRDADFVAALSAELAEEVATLTPAPVSVVPNGVNVARVRRLAAEPFDHPFLDGAAPVLVSVGRLTRQKGFDLAIRALALLPDERFLIIGAGKEMELRRLAAEMGVADRVAFLGFQANPFAIMARCDLYVSTSRWEGASNALLEALAVGLPLAATDAPTGNREILGEGRYGTLAPVEDPAGLAAAIRTELAIRRDPAAQRAAADALDIRLCLDRWVALLSAARTDP